VTNHQHLAVGFGLMLFSLIGLVPPWVHVRIDDPTVRIPVGYSFITIGVPIQVDEATRGWPNRRSPNYEGAPAWLWSSDINTPRLATQWAAVALVTGNVVWLLARRRRSSESKPSRPRHG